MNRFVTIILFAAAVLPGLCPASAQTSKRDAIGREISTLDGRLKEISGKSSAAETSLALTREKIAACRKLVEESSAEYVALGDSVRRAERAVSEAQKRLDELQEGCDRLVRSAYLNRDARVWYMYLFASEDFARAMRRYDYLKSLSHTLTAQSEEVRAGKEALERRAADLRALRAKAAESLSRRTADLRRLSDAESREKSIIRNLKKESASVRKQLEKRRKEAEALKAGVGKAVSSKQKTSNPKLSKSFAASKGALPWPVDDGIVTGEFGQHNHPVYKNVKLPFNNGINISVPKGAVVRAVYSGTVAHVAVMPGYNQCVLVQHGDYFTFYCKLSTVSVKAGDRVSSGQAVGTVATGADGAQFHFEIWKGRSPQNPGLWLSKRK